jgi:hypothetical protein
LSKHPFDQAGEPQTTFFCYALATFVIPQQLLSFLRKQESRAIDNSGFRIKRPMTAAFLYYKIRSCLLPLEPVVCFVMDDVQWKLEMIDRQFGWVEVI